MQNNVFRLLLLVVLVLPPPAWSLTSAQYDQLKTELQTDPLALGYNIAPDFFVTNNNDAALAPMLNAVHEGQPFQIDNVISNAQLWGAIVSDELTALVTAQRTLLQIALQVPTFDLAVPETRKKLGDIFPAGSQTRTNLQAMQKRQGSRAEVLFGRGTTIRIADVACALRTVGCP